MATKRTTGRKRGRPPTSPAHKALVRAFAAEVKERSGLSLTRIEAALGIGGSGSRNGRTFWAYLHGERAMSPARLVTLARRALNTRNTFGVPWISFVLYLRALEQHDRWNRGDREIKEQAHAASRNAMLRDKASRKALAPIHENLKAALDDLVRLAASKGRNYVVDEEILKYRLEFPSESGHLEVRHLGLAVQEAMELALSPHGKFAADHFQCLRPSVP